MEPVITNSGCIEVICGPMFSGKTEELIKRLKRAHGAGKRIAVFKPSIDSRYSDSEIVSHANARMRSEMVESPKEILRCLDRWTAVVGIDEANFFGPALVPVARKLVLEGKQVIIAGLDMDYLGRPFAPVPELLRLSASTTKLLAICTRCGAPANYSQRIVKSEELILVGAVDSYESRCQHCFEPDVSRHDALEVRLTGRTASALH